MMDFLKKFFRGKTVKPRNLVATQEKRRQLPTLVMDGEVTDVELVQLVRLNVNFDSKNLSWYRDVFGKRVKLYGIENLKDMSFDAIAEIFSGTVYCNSELVLAQWVYFKVKEAIRDGTEWADITEVFNSDFHEDGKSFPYEEIRKKFMKVFKILEDSEDELKVRLKSSLNS